MSHSPKMTPSKTLPPLPHGGVARPQWFLTCRIERPIVGCELTPTSFLTIKGGMMDNLTRAKIVENAAHRYRYIWYRSVEKQDCANPDCKRDKSYNPVDWSTFALGAPSISCAFCERYNNTHLKRQEGDKPHQIFCSKACFKVGWKKHVEMYHPKEISEKLSTDLEDDSSPMDLIISKDDDVKDIQNTENDNKRIRAMTNDDNRWTMIVEDGEMYIPGPEDVGRALKVECYALTTNNGDGMKHEENILVGPCKVFTETVLSYPAFNMIRNHVNCNNGEIGFKNKPNRNNLRIVSYNVLAEIYATKMAYPYCDNWILSWPYRRSLLLQELSYIEADIICLQEIQSDHFEADINTQMRAMGYDSLFRQKSRESMGQYGKVDGCAIFYNANKLQLVDFFDIDFNEEARQEVKHMKYNDQQARKYLTRVSKDNIAQIVEFESTIPNGESQKFVVSNTHLYSNSRQPDVKLLQTWILLTRIQQYLQKRHQQGEDLGVILCGDFNSLSDSAVYSFLSEGVVQHDHAELEGVTDIEMTLPNLQNVNHQIQLYSAMTVNNTQEEPSFTNYTQNFKGTLDYIWYTPYMFNIDAYLQIPKEEDICKHAPALPSATFPSDHVMLSCDLSFGGINGKDYGGGRVSSGSMSGGKSRGRGGMRR